MLSFEKPFLSSAGIAFMSALSRYSARGREISIFPSETASPTAVEVTDFVAEYAG